MAANRGEAVLLNRVLLAGLRLAGRIGTDNQLCAHIFRLAQILEASVPTTHLREADVDDAWRIVDQRSTAYGSALSLIEMLVNGLGILDSGSASAHHSRVNRPFARLATAIDVHAKISNALFMPGSASDRGLRQTSSATCRSSVARRGQSCETWDVRGEPAGYELREEPHALRLTRFALREEPERAVHVRAVPSTLTSNGSESPTKQGSVVIPGPCRTATICAPASVVLNGPSAVETSPSRAQSGTPSMFLTIYRMGSGAPARHATSMSRDMYTPPNSSGPFRP